MSGDEMPERPVEMVELPVEMLDGDSLALRDALDDATAPPAPVRRRANPIVGIVELAVGVLAIIAGTMWWQGIPMIQRAALVVGGLVVMYLGIRSVVHAFRPQADVALWLSVAWLGILTLVAILAPILPLGEREDVSKTLLDPTLQRPNIFSKHPLGTNVDGLDILARVIYGARASLVMGVVAVAIGMLIGGLLGLIAGYVKGPFSWIVNVLNDTMIAFPPLVLLLALAAVMDKDVKSLAIALGVLAIPVNYRLARANTLAVSEQAFVTAARSMGASRRRVLFRELMPNVAPQLLSYALILMAILIVAEASLSYLGLGVQRPTPSWGNMIAEGDGGYFERNPHLVFAPGITIFLTVFAFNLVGGRARQRWDRTSG